MKAKKFKNKILAMFPTITEMSNVNEIENGMAGESFSISSMTWCPVVSE